ncbi:hypothetical protein F2P81_025288 [Scophthalmus maximus]|uniref:Uncharacterized protein n=1 Tax=Scophthalmus maximus TaxID=52904 RepID=A0A6A4RQQ1_SCOMX|nr:hypothetical protein F2P81_025288 [Scophthalmus maximus]
MVSVFTDGAPIMRGAQKRFVTLLQKLLDRKLLTFHCINKIMAKGLNHRKFCSLSDEGDSAYSDLLLHKVRWLSRREVLKRFAACLEHVKNGLIYPELEYPDWLEKLHFMVDMTGHFNTMIKVSRGVRSLTSPP